MYGIKKIELNLENCESFEFSGTSIGRLHIGRLDTSINRIAGNAFEKQTIARDIVIEVHKREDVNYVCYESESKETKFERLQKYPDVVSITITYDDDTTETYLVDWVEEGYGNNVAQQVEVTKYGDLRLVISNEKDISDYFVDETEDTRNFSWSMLCDIEE